MKVTPDVIRYIACPTIAALSCWSITDENGYKNDYDNGRGIERGDLEEGEGGRGAKELLL